MSGSTACGCKPREVVVTARKCNHSAFNGGHYTPSDYSEVMCIHCLGRWRTTAVYVDKMPDAPKDWWSIPWDKVSALFQRTYRIHKASRR